MKQIYIVCAAMSSAAMFCHRAVQKSIGTLQRCSQNLKQGGAEFFVTTPPNYDHVIIFIDSY